MDKDGKKGVAGVSSPAKGSGPYEILHFYGFSFPGRFFTLFFHQGCDKYIGLLLRREGFEV